MAMVSYKFITAPNILVNIWMASVHLYKASLQRQEDCVWQANGLRGPWR